MTALLLCASWLQADAAWCRPAGRLLAKQFQCLGAVWDSASRPLTLVHYNHQRQQDSDTWGKGLSAPQVLYGP